MYNFFMSRYNREHYLANREKILAQHIAHHKRYKEHYDAYKKEWSQKNKIKLFFYQVLGRIKKRCNNKKYQYYKYYGGKGIKANITLKELQILWKRDKGWLLKKPSIDRIDSNKDYYFENCQFIEHSENCAKAHRGRKHTAISRKRMSISAKARWK